MSILPKVCSTSITERDSKKNDSVLKRNKRFHTGLFIFWTLPDNLLGLNRPMSEIESIKTTHVIPRPLLLRYQIQKQILKLKNEIFIFVYLILYNPLFFGKSYGYQPLKWDITYTN